MHLIVAVHGYLHPFGEGVNHGDANAMQAARHLVAPGSEFAAGV